MKLSTEFSKGKTDKDENEAFDSAYIKEVSYLLRYFTIYSSLLFRTLPPGVQTPLIAALLAYIDRLFGYSMVYTLDPIKKFHQVYHNRRIHTGITDPSGLVQWEKALVDRYLQAKKQVTAPCRPSKEALGPNVGNASYVLLMSGPWTGGTPTLYQGRQACILWNQTRQCPQYCRYQHVCLNCKRNHPAGSCPTWLTTLSQTA